MARSLSAHSRRLRARDALEIIRQRVLPVVLAALAGAVITASVLGGI